MTDPHPSEADSAPAEPARTGAQRAGYDSVERPPEIPERPTYDITGVSEPTHREKVQRTLAYALVAVLAATIAASLVLLVLAKTIGVPADTLKSFVDPFFAAVVTLVSTVVGFYFGSEAGKSRDG